MSKVLVIILFLVLPLVSGVYRSSTADFEMDRLAPNTSFGVRMRILFETSSPTVRMHAYLPRNESSISLGSRWTNTDLINSAEFYRGGNRQLEWWGETHGRGKVETAFSVITKPVTYEIAPTLKVPGRPDDRDLPFLEATETVQVDAPEIAALADRLAPRGSSSVQALRRIYSYCVELSEPSSDGGRQASDALSVLRSKSGKTLGGSRLFAAIARRSGLPTRLVQGLLLDPGHNLAPTTWVEVRLGLAWVPFCPTAGLFARNDGRLLPFCRGDLAVIGCVPPAGVQTVFDVERTFAVRGRLTQESAKGSLSLMSAWAALEESGISVSVLCIVLMLPFGALVCLFLRNIIGIQTFGFFLPVLVAVAAMRSGLIWAYIGLLFVIGVVFIFRLLTGPLRMLHYPRLTAALTLTVVTVLGLATIGALTGNVQFTYVTYLPVVVLTITTEQFSNMVDEEEPIEVFKAGASTIVAISLCYFVMSSYALQKFVFTFPEIFMILIFLDIFLGCWMGMRFLEIVRFRRLSVREQELNCG